MGKNIQPEIENAAVDFIKAWRDFRRGHDLESAKLNCCDYTRDLFKAAQTLDDALTKSYDTPKREDGANG